MRRKVLGHVVHLSVWESAGVREKRAAGYFPPGGGGGVPLNTLMGGWVGRKRLRNNS